MRAAAILGLGCSSKDLKPFQSDASIQWQLGMPSPGSADVVLLFGGDGTIHRHLGQLVQLGVPVLIVPAGSGNDFATSLGLKRVRDSQAAWQQFCNANGRVREIDVGVISALPSSDASLHSRYFCCVAGVGLDGEVARRANNLPRWLRGHGGYVLSVAPTILTFDPFPLKLQVRDANANWTVRSDKPALVAVFANTPLYGGGMKVAPRAQMDDGMLDVCLVGAVSRLKLFGVFPSVFAGRHLGIREVEYFQTEVVRVDPDPPLDVYADGEYVCRTPIEVSVARSALRVITL